MRQDQLFHDDYLSSYLTSLEMSMNSYIQNLDLQKVIRADESALVQELMVKFVLDLPKLLEEKTAIDPQEAEITLNQGRNSGDVFGDDYGDRTVKGLYIKVSVPFEGSSSLFRYRPSTFTFSGTPSAQIENDFLVMEYETTEKDEGKIKQLWEHDFAEIKKHLEFVGADIKHYNDSLEQKIRVQVANRKKEAGGNQSLIDALKR